MSTMLRYKQAVERKRAINQLVEAEFRRIESLASEYSWLGLPDDKLDDEDLLKAAMDVVFNGTNPKKALMKVYDEARQ